MGVKVLIKDVTGVGGHYMAHSDMPCRPHTYTAKAGLALDFYPVAGTERFTSRPAWLDVWRIAQPCTHATVHDIPADVDLQIRAEVDQAEHCILVRKPWPFLTHAHSSSCR